MKNCLSVKKNLIKEVALGAEDEGDGQGAEPGAMTHQPGKPAGMFGE